MAYSAAIQAHPKRSEFIPYLRQTLGDVPVAWDQKHSVWDTWKRAAELHDPAADYHLVVQDDAQFCRRFTDRLDKVLTKDFDAYCLFFRFKGRRTHAEFNEAARQGKASGGFAFPRMQFCVATVLRTSILPDLLAYCDTIGGPEQEDDLRISRYLNREGIEVFYPLPSLVNHRIGPSVINAKRPTIRRATWFE